MQKPKFKILSIDGGGIRGVIPCTILAFLESQLGDLRGFDLISGTSTGGIIALGLGKPDGEGGNLFTAKDMLELYQKNGKAIFEKRREDFWSWLGSLIKFSEVLSRKAYQSINIESILLEYFGDTRLKELQPPVLITAYDLEQAKPFYFSTRIAKKEDRENLLLREIARSTSAAPTYFEPSVVKYQEEEDLAFIDGGVFANNPAMLAYCEAKELWKQRSVKAFDPDVLADDNDLPFFMLSLGTGHSTHTISGQEAKNWRGAQWINPMLNDIFMHSIAESTHYMMQHLLPPYKDGTLRYQRLDMVIPKEYSQMDNASAENIEKLCGIADKYVKDNEGILLKLCDLLS